MTDCTRTTHLGPDGRGRPPRTQATAQELCHGA
jgi:hypothetical protein